MTGQSGWRGAVPVAMTLLLGTALGSVLTLPAFGQGMEAASGRLVDFAMPAQPMPAALVQFGRAAGVQISMDAAAARGLTAPALRGRMEIETALARLLAGSGLSFARAGEGLYVVSARQAARAEGDQLILAPIELAAAGLGAGQSGSGLKTDAPAVEVPQAVSVVTEAEFEARGVKDLNDTVAYTPGVRAVDYPGNQGMPRIYLRGFRSQSQRAYYLDGLRNGYNPYDSTLEPFALQGLEVLRGPASALYGDALPGGLIAATSKQPDGREIRHVQLQYGSHDRKQLGLDFGGALNESGSIDYRFVMIQRDSGSQIDHSPDNLSYFAPSLGFQLGEGTRLTLRASHTRAKRGGSEQSIPYDNAPGGSGPEIPWDLMIGGGEDSYWKPKTTTLGWEFTHDFAPNWSFSQNARFFYTDLDYVSSFDYSYPIAVLADDTILVGMQKRPRTSRGFVLDNTLNGRVETGAVAHDLLFGLSYGKYRLRETRTNSTNSNALDIDDPDYDFDYSYGLPWSDDLDRIEQAGVYAQDRARWGNWIATANLRYDHVRSISTDLYSNTIYAAYSGDVTNAYTDEKVTGRLGLSYLFSPDLSVYGSYATSFEPQLGTDRAGDSFQPTEGQQYETGVKWRPNAKSLVSLSLFQLTQQNVTTPDPENTSYSVQTGEVRSRGIELEYKGEISPALGVIASYGYADATVTKDNPNAQGISKKGTRVEAIPYNTAALWFDYRPQAAGFAGLTLGLGARYVGSSALVMNASTGKQLTSDGYTLLDASVSYDLGAVGGPDGVSVTLAANNLTDEKYVTPGYYSNSVLYGKRRSLSATLDYRW